MTGSTAAAVLWDMDGVLVDSEPLWTIAETELYAGWGKVWGPEAKAACIGKRLDLAVPIMIAFAGVEADVAEVSAWLQGRMVELFRERLPVRDGALELLEAIHARGVPQALVSASYRALVDAALDTIGREVFAYSLGGDEVTHAKPHPEAYLRAAAAVGAEPGACVVLEDSLTGVQSAEAAGCICVALPEHVHIPPTPSRPVRASFRDLDPDWLLSLPAS